MSLLAGIPAPSESLLWELHPKATLWTFHPQRLRESSVLDDLLDENIRLKIKDLSKETEDKTCPVCQNDYQENYANSVDGRKVSDAGELPIKLPICGHVFGHDCIRRWATNNTCPLCREPLLYSKEVAPGVADLDLRDCAFIADLDYAGRLMRLLREFEEKPEPPRLSLLERRGRRPLTIETGAQPPVVARSPIPENLRIVPPGDWVGTNVPEPRPEARNPAPTLLERRGRQPLQVNTGIPIARRAASVDALPPTPTRSPIRRRERYIPLTLLPPQHQPRHPTSRLEYRLYTWLLAHNIALPVLSNPGSDEQLTPQQEQALFAYIQSQGAFHYPGMVILFRDRGVSSDRDVYAQLRRMGLFWMPCGAWGRRDGEMVFVSYCLAERLRGRRGGDEERRVEGREMILGVQQEEPQGVEVIEPTLGPQQENPREMEANEPEMRVPPQRPAGRQTRRGCLFRQVRNRLFGRNHPPRDLETGDLRRARWLRFTRPRRRSEEDHGS